MKYEEYLSRGKFKNCNFVVYHFCGQIDRKSKNLEKPDFYSFPGDIDLIEKDINLYEKN